MLKGKAILTKIIAMIFFFHFLNFSGIRESNLN